MSAPKLRANVYVTPPQPTEAALIRGAKATLFHAPPESTEATLFYAREADDIARSYERCPNATALLNEVERYLIEELPAWPAEGTDIAWLKSWLERVVIALGMSIDEGRDVAPDFVAMALNRMLARR